jgi:hypothetical protein
MQTDNSKIWRLSYELQWLRNRYDSGAVFSGAYAVVKRIENDIAWTQYEREQRENHES